MTFDLIKNSSPIREHGSRYRCVLHGPPVCLVVLVCVMCTWGTECAWAGRARKEERVKMERGALAGCSSNPRLG